MGESRIELIAWLNDLLQIQYTKVEQCGSGAAYCQVIDSIYGDVPMKKVKMNSKAEHEHVVNYKVLQNTFKTHNIDKPIPVDRLIKCKMQDNLEFLQWLKKFWDLNFPGGEYDPIARRNGLGIEPPIGGAAARGRTPVNAPAPAAVRRAPVATTTTTAAARRPIGGAARGSTTTSARASTSSSAQAELNALTSQMEEMKLTVDSMEKERSFYYEKLRSIEILIVARLESEDETITESERETLKAIETILYSTEEGFEVPEEGEEELGPEEDEEETF